jgi:ribosomal protein L17
LLFGEPRLDGFEQIGLRDRVRRPGYTQILRRRERRGDKQDRDRQE